MASHGTWSRDWITDTVNITWMWLLSERPIMHSCKSKHTLKLLQNREHSCVLLEALYTVHNDICCANTHLARSAFTGITKTVEVMGILQLLGADCVVQG